MIEKPIDLEKAWKAFLRRHKKHEQKCKEIEAKVLSYGKRVKNEAVHPE